MSNEDRVVIRVSKATHKVIAEYAKYKDLDVGEAADKLIATADSRLAALERYAADKGKAKKKSKKK